MKKTHKYLLAGAVLSMTLGMSVMGVSAAQRYWVNEDDGWRYYDSKGQMVVDQEKRINGAWYSFDEEGWMRSDQLIERDGSIFYIYPGDDGKLAEGKWVRLDAEGHKCTDTDDNCGCEWYYFTKIEEVAEGRLEGGMVIDQEKRINGKWYSFGPDGVMRSDEIVEINEFGDWTYAFPDGHLDEKEWVRLDGSGKYCQHDELCDCSWYWFKALTEREEGYLTGGAIINKARQIRGAVYAFDENGAMIFRNWGPALEESEETEGEAEAQAAPLEELAYYQYSGEQARSKWLSIDGFWYRFNSKGKVVECIAVDPDEGGMPAVDIEVSTGDVPSAQISSIGAVGETDVEVEAGKEVRLQFQIELATDSNAARKSFSEDQHDVWIVREQGSYTAKIEKITTAGLCTILYQNDNLTDGTRVWLGVDDIQADTPFTISTFLPEGKTEEEHLIDNAFNVDAGDLLEKLNSGSEEEKTAAVEQINKSVQDLKELYTGGTEETAGQVKTQILDNTSQLEKLDKAYQKANDITVKGESVTNDAKEQIGGSVELVGGSLNAVRGEEVQLTIDVPGEDAEWEIEDADSYNVTVAFDIKLLFDGIVKEELSLPVVITMPLPVGFKDIRNAADLKLVNIHNGTEYELDKIISGGKVTFVTDRFSTYVFARSQAGNDGSDYDDSSSDRDSGSSSRSKSSSQSGQWVQDAKGWWFRYASGSYPKDSWQFLEYNGTSRWYRFNGEGYINTGWFTDIDGHTYYLNPVSDGTLGAMMTGWQQIDGQWYFLNPEAGGPQGALMVNTTTPDGYHVNEKG